MISFGRNRRTTSAIWWSSSSFYFPSSPHLSPPTRKSAFSPNFGPLSSPSLNSLALVWSQLVSVFAGNTLTPESPSVSTLWRQSLGDVDNQTLCWCPPVLLVLDALVIIWWQAGLSAWETVEFEKYGGLWCFVYLHLDRANSKYITHTCIITLSIFSVPAYQKSGWCRMKMGHCAG